jgi:hypothetical protein
VGASDDETMMFLDFDRDDASLAHAADWSSSLGGEGRVSGFASGRCSGMTRWLLPILVLAACDGTATHKPDPATARVPTGRAAITASSTASSNPAGTRVLTVLPYVVTDGMEHGPRHVVLDETGKRRFVRLAGLPDEEGYSRLVRVKPAAPPSGDEAKMADFVAADYRVERVLAERREDPSVDWSAPVVFSSIERSDACLEITVQVFESHTFCGRLAGFTTDEGGALLFLERDFYPFPAGGAPLSVSVVPELTPMK